jgi:hypothetical protein
MSLIETALGAPAVVPVIAAGQAGVGLLDEPDELEPVVSRPMSVCIAWPPSELDSEAVAAWAADPVDGVEPVGAGAELGATVSLTFNEAAGSACAATGELLATNEMPPTAEPGTVTLVPTA